MNAELKKNDVSQSNGLGSGIDKIFDRQLPKALELRSSTAAMRIAKLKKLRKSLEKYKQELLHAGAKDFNKPLIEMEITEVLSVTLEIEHTCKHLKKWLKPKKIAPTALMLGTSSEVRYEPRGRCLIISPWNYPLTLTFGPLVPAIASGNTVIIKTSELTPNISAVMVKIIQDAFHQNEVAILEGDASVATKLLSLPFDHIFFTGSPEIGKVVMAAAAKHLSSVTLELGGKSPTIIDETADIDLAVKTLAWGKFLNCGQTCIAPDHLYIAESIKDKFISKFTQHITSVYGSGNEAKNSDLARIVNVRHTSRIESLINDAKDKGAKVIYGGVISTDERFISPTLITDVPRESKILSEEIFGPVLPIITFKNINEVISNINNAPKPLAIYIWSQDKRFTEYVIQNTSSGGTCINHNMAHFLQNNLPFGGVNNSGIGSYHAEWGIKAFSHERAILKTHLMMTHLFYPPYTKTTRRILDSIFKFF
jgi:aldehyde dehydrogenase (NAD+)